MGKFTDGLKDMFSGLVNRRNSLNRNQVVVNRLSDEELREMYKTGVMSKVFRLKAGYALNDTIKFATTEDKAFYNERIAKHFKKALKYSLGFGRGAIIVFNKDDDLSMPLKCSDPKSLQMRVFSGDMVKANSPIYDLRNPRYYKATYYTVNGQNVHWSRVIDLTYYEPCERDKPDYNYGGISESQLVYEQFVADGVVQRAAPTIIEKASTFVYKIKGYKEKLAMKQEDAMIKYVSTCEDGRNIYGALITDAEDDVTTLTQSLTDLDKVDNVTLRRLAMVTGLGMTILIGEQASGMNSSGQEERQGFQDTIENLQSDYLLEPLAHIAKIFGLGKIEFKENQGQSAAEKVAYDKTAVDVAKILWEIGEDANAYLKDKDVLAKDDWDSFWAKDESKEIDEPDTSTFGDAKIKGKNGYVGVSLHSDDARAINDWLKETGVSNTISANDMHATLFYASEGMSEIDVNPNVNYQSAVKNDITYMGEPESEWYAIAIHLGGGELSERHERIKSLTGASHSYPDFKAHLSLKYKPKEGDLEKMQAVKFPLGSVRFNNETQEDIK